LLDALVRAVPRVPPSRSPRDDTNTKKNGATKNIDLSVSDVRGSQRYFTVALLPPRHARCVPVSQSVSRSTSEVLDPNLAI